MLLGNKKDLAASGERQIDFLTASNYAQENECLLFETSAMTGENIEHSFEVLIKAIQNKINNGEIKDDDYSARKHVQNLSSDRR